MPSTSAAAPPATPPAMAPAWLVWRCFVVAPPDEVLLAAALPGAWGSVLEEEEEEEEDGLARGEFGFGLGDWEELESAGVVPAVCPALVLFEAVLPAAGVAVPGLGEGAADVVGLLGLCGCGTSAYNEHSGLRLMRTEVPPPPGGETLFVVTALPVVVLGFVAGGDSVGVGAGVEVTDGEIWLAQCVNVLLLFAACTFSAFSFVQTLN